MEEIVLKDRKFYFYSVNNCINELEWARKTALLKYSNTYDSWKKRTDTQRFINIFLGDLSKNIFKKMLIEKNPRINEFLFEYDLIRTDNFKQSDLFDLKISKNSFECEIEVKSSGEKYSANPPNLLNRRLIINIDNVHSHFSCLYVQLIFLSLDLEFFSLKFENDNIEEFSHFYVEQFLSKNIDVIFVGYANKKMQEEAKAKIFEVENIIENDEKRKYADLLIKDVLKPDYFFEVLEKYV